MTIYYKIKHLEGRVFRYYYAKSTLSWLPYFTPTTMAAFELPSNEIEERTIIAQSMGISLKQINFKWD